MEESGGEWEPQARKCLKVGSRWESLEHMFFGRFEHTVDDKGRLTLPAKYRATLAAGVVITRGIDHCLYIYPLAVWQQFADGTRQLPVTSTDARAFVRLVFAEAADCVPDKQGRVLIPGYLREYANLSSEVIIVGCQSRLEVWNPQAWREDRSRLEKDPEALAEKLGDLGIL
jgi:MraZ protein